MSLWKRFVMIFKSKAHRVADKYENPSETLDYSYQRQLELLAKVKGGLTDVATSRKRVELQLTAVQNNVDKLTDQAKKALDMGREDLAREALTRKAALMGQLQELTAQKDSLMGEEEKLRNASQQLSAKVESFRTRKETIKATYSAAQAQTRINEAVAGIGGEFGDVGLALQRAEDKTAQMQARAGALDELLASGALDEPFTSGNDSLSRELAAASADADIENELAALKAGTTPALGSSTQGAPILSETTVEIEGIHRTN